MWLDSHQTAEAADYEQKQRELEGKFNPIMMRVYAATGGQPPRHNDDD